MRWNLSQLHTRASFAGLTLAASLLFVAAPTRAQTAVPAGALASDETWVASGSPYVLEGTLSIPTSRTLRIEAGVEVRVPPAQSLAVSGGTLVAVGTEAARVTLRSTVSGARWTGIVSAAGMVELEHVDFLEVNAPLDTRGGGSLRFVTSPGGATLRARAGRVSIRDSDLGPADFSETAVATVERSVFRGAVFFRGGRAAVDHATFLGDILGSGGADITDSIVVRPRDIVCACVLDRVLVEPLDRGATRIAVDEIRDPLTPERALLGAALRPTSRSPARFRDRTGGDLGARPYAGEPTATLQGWLWDDLRLTRGEASSIAGDLTVPPGRTLLVEPGVALSFPSGSDGLAHALRVFGALAWGASEGPPVRFVGTPASGDFAILVAAGGEVSLTEVELEGTRIELAAGASATLTAVSVSSADEAFVARNGSRFAIDRLRVSGRLGLHGTGLASNVYVRADDTGLALAPGTGDRVEVRHATVQCTAVLGTVGAEVVATGGGRVSLAYDVITGCGMGLTGASRGLEVAGSWLGGNAEDVVGMAIPSGVTLADPRLGATGWPRSGSPCVDAAIGSSQPLDLDGVRRPVDGDATPGAVADVGAFEVGIGICGDGALDPGERCDDGPGRGYGWDACGADCRGHGPYCGDGRVTGPEEACDGGGCSSACRLLPGDAGVLADASAEPDAALAELDAGGLDAGGLDADAREGEPLDGGSPDGSLEADGGSVDASSPRGEVGASGDGAVAAGDAALDVGATLEDAGAVEAAPGCDCRAHGARSAGQAWASLGLAACLACLCARRSRRRGRSW